MGQFRFSYIDPSPIGHGGFGRVHRIRITESNSPGFRVGQVYAAKSLNPNWESNPEAQQRFDREISTLSRMDHQSIVKCVGQNLPGGTRFYVMPLYGDSLRKLIARQPFGIDWRQVALHGAALADALAYAHGLGFLHRDIKPENILFNPGGHLVLSDWGIGRFVHQYSVVLQQLTRGGMGTQYYCSAEQWFGHGVDERADVYALGMTLDELFMGRQRQLSTVGEGIVAAIDHRKTFGAQYFETVIRAMTRSDRGNRMNSMKAVAGELRLAASME